MRLLLSAFLVATAVVAVLCLAGAAVMMASPEQTHGTFLRHAGGRR